MDALHTTGFFLTRAWLLGFSAGAVCLATCAPVLLPFILTQEKKLKSNIVYTVLFLIGRLAGYLGFAVAAFFLGHSLESHTPGYSFVTAGLMILLAAAMVWYSLSFKDGVCSLRFLPKKLMTALRDKPSLYPLVVGLLTGLNVCPPFLMALAESGGADSLVQSVLFFLVFYGATLLFFIPIPFFGYLKKIKGLRYISQIIIFIMAGFYLYKGIIQFYGGLVKC